MHARTLAALALGAAALLTVSSAMADRAEVHEGGSIAGLTGFGANAYGANFGVRGGYTLPSHLYVGGTILGNTGLGNSLLPGWGLGFTMGGEVGYDIVAGPLVVRPYGGLGFTSQTYNGYVGYGGYGGYGYNATLCAEGQYQYCSASAAPNPSYNPTLCARGVTQDCSPYLDGVGGPGASTLSLAFWAGGTVLYDFKGGPWFVSADFRIGDAPGFALEQAIFAVMVGGGYAF
jgi:hypothetical protein